MESNKAKLSFYANGISYRVTIDSNDFDIVMLQTYDDRYIDNIWRRNDPELRKEFYSTTIHTQDSKWRMMAEKWIDASLIRNIISALNYNLNTPDHSENEKEIFRFIIEQSREIWQLNSDEPIPEPIPHPY